MYTCIMHVYTGIYNIYGYYMSKCIYVCDDERECV